LDFSLSLSVIHSLLNRQNLGINSGIDDVLVSVDEEFKAFDGP